MVNRFCYKWVAVDNWDFCLRPYCLRIQARRRMPPQAEPRNASGFFNWPQLKPHPLPTPCSAHGSLRSIQSDPVMARPVRPLNTTRSGSPHRSSPESSVDPMRKLEKKTPATTAQSTTPEYPRSTFGALADPGTDLVEFYLKSLATSPSTPSCAGSFFQNCYPHEWRGFGSMG